MPAAVADRGLLARFGAAVKSWLSGPAGPINWTQNGGIPVGWNANFWQQNLHPYQGGESATVNACVNAYAQTIAQLPGGHFRKLENGGQELITTSPLSRILRAPNPYQTRSDFMLGLVVDLLFTGNAYAWAERDDASRITALHLVPARGVEVLLDPESRAVFYGLTENPVAGVLDFAIPERDVLHIRCRTKSGEPFKGLSPLRWAAAAMAANTSITASQAAFFAQASQPSGFLSSDQALSGSQMAELREAWENRAAGIAAGSVPILGGGMKFNQLTMTSQDAQLVEAFRMTVGDIARAFGVPLPIIGDLSNATFNNTEQLLAFWLSTGLGFYVEHIEIAFDRFFGLPADQFTELDTDVLLRTQFKDRIDGLTKAIVGGLMSPNEARRKEGLPDAEAGDEPRVQAQVVPLSQAEALPAPAAPVPEVPALPPPDGAAVSDETAEQLRGLSAMITKLMEPRDSDPVLTAQVAAIAEEQAAQRKMIEELPAPPEPAADPTEALALLTTQVAAIAAATGELRTMLEAAEPALDPDEALELAILQLRKAKEAHDVT